MKRYKNLIGLALIIVLAVGLYQLGMSAVVCALGVGCWQLMQFAQSKAYRKGVCFTTVLTPEQIKEFETILNGVKSYDQMFKDLADIAKMEGGFAAIKKLPELLKSEQKRNDELHAEVKKLSKRLIENQKTGVVWRNGIPYVTDECAQFCGSMAVLRAAQSNKIKGANAEDLITRAATFLGMEVKTAIATTDIPMPVQYASQIVELVYAYGQARKLCTVYPLGTASVKLPRLKTGEPAFAFIAVSGPVLEKVPQMEFITFTPGKAGGIARIPSEIDADSIVSVGQFVARYIAREMAKLEDTCLFLGDGTATYNSINGIGAQAAADGAGALVTLAAGKTKPSDITLANCRDLRSKVTGAVLKTAKYFAHPSMESLFVTYNTSATVVPFQRRPDGTATLDGYEVVWINTMPIYQTTANASAYQIYFGDLSWWYFGERLALSVETSRDVYFATDEIGIRALERIDIHQMGQSSSAALQLAAV
ncbi:MAG: phage major capsid protein [Bryobacteraceae bacterium]